MVLRREFFQGYMVLISLATKDGDLYPLRNAWREHEA